MKNPTRRLILPAMAALLICGGPAMVAEKLVILHTNDTHSLIDPNDKDLGGVLRRKALFDSVRAADPNVILVDAGDAVQGTLYFKFFHGDVEYPVMNMLGYDIRILGNHEFDNGLEELARYWKDVKATSLSANYDFTGTPLEGMFDPWCIREVDGHKIGFIGINIDPESLIAQANYDGMGFRDVIATANETAAFLKKQEGCDLVVAVTHIGYVKENEKTTDVDLARASRDIDIIIGGHSHTLIDPDNPEQYPSLVPNAEGRGVLVTQTGKSGLNVGRIEIDLDRLDAGKTDGRDFGYSLIPVDSRLDRLGTDTTLRAFIDHYRAKVDSVNSRPVAIAATDMSNNDRTGAFPNWTADYALDFGRMIADSLRRAGNDVADVDLGLMNVGGIRSSWDRGIITEGDVLSTFPFSNHMVLTAVPGRDLIRTMEIVAPKGGECVSYGVSVVTDSLGHTQVTLDGKPVDPDREYVVSTIDYVAWGNDDMTPMANGRWIWRDDQEVSTRMMDYVRGLTDRGVMIDPDPRARFVTRMAVPWQEDSK